MPKLKTNKATRKRFQVTKRRKVLALKTKRRHLLGDRTPAKKRRARRKQLANRVDTKMVLRYLPYGA